MSEPTPGVNDGSRQRTPSDEIEKVTRPAAGRAQPAELSNEDAVERTPAERDEQQ